MAVQSLWGGPTSSDKRDWLCGAISDMLTTRPETDAEDLEDVLIQVMSDEFDVVVDDESAMNVAAEIMDVRTRVAAGDTAVVQDMWEKWAAKGKKADTGAFRRVEQDGEESDSESEDEGGDGEDVEMDDAPSEAARGQRERVEPEVDEDGFTKVVGKKKR